MSALRSLLAEATTNALDSIFSWEASVLFASFVIITLLWEFIAACLAWITVHFTGRKALWLRRLKDEILALGIITLLLNLIQGQLTKICIPGTDSSGYDNGKCPEGERQMFNAHLIHEVHLLLFQTAVMYIVITTLTFYSSIIRMRMWRVWEKNARYGDPDVNLREEELAMKLGPNWVVHVLRSMWHTLQSGVSHRIYSTIRILIRLRLDHAMAAEGISLPRSFNFLNFVSQAMEVEFSMAAENTWVTFIVMAVFLVIPSFYYPIYFLSGAAILSMICISSKLQSVIIHLAAMTFYDFSDEIKSVNAEHARAYHRILKRSASHKPPGTPTSPTSNSVASLSLSFSATPLSNVRNIFSYKARDTPNSAQDGGHQSKDREKLGQEGRNSSSLAHNSKAGYSRNSNSSSIALSNQQGIHNSNQSYNSNNLVHSNKREHLNDNVTMLSPQSQTSSHRSRELILSPSSIHNHHHHHHHHHQMAIPEDEALEMEGLNSTFHTDCSNTQMHRPSCSRSLNTSISMFSRAGDEDSRRGSLDSSMFTDALNTSMGASARPRTSVASIASSGFRSSKVVPVHALPHEPMLDGKAEDGVLSMSYRLRAHFRDPHTGQMLGNANKLFWLHSPLLMLWWFQIAYMSLSIALSLVVFGIWRDKGAFVDDQGGVVALVFLVFSDLGAIVYAAMAIMPVYSLVNIAAHGDPKWMMHEVQRLKLATEDEFEEGFGGMLLRQCCRPAERENTEAETEYVKIFLSLLSHQAGIIDASGHNANNYAGLGQFRNPGQKGICLVVHFVKAWRDCTEDWRIAMSEGRSYQMESVAVDGELDAVREAFNHIDRDNDGVICREDLKVILRGVGTRATAEDLEDMVEALDVDGKDRISFQEFLLFMLFKFFDLNNDGLLTRDDVHETLKQMGIAHMTEDVERLIDFLMTARQGSDLRRRIELAEFIHCFLPLHFTGTAPIQADVTCLDSSPETDHRDTPMVSLMPAPNWSKHKLQVPSPALHSSTHQVLKFDLPPKPRHIHFSNSDPGDGSSTGPHPSGDGAHPSGPQGPHQSGDDPHPSGLRGPHPSGDGAPSGPHPCGNGSSTGLHWSGEGPHPIDPHIPHLSGDGPHPSRVGASTGLHPSRLSLATMPGTIAVTSLPTTVQGAAPMDGQPGIGSDTSISGLEKATGEGLAEVGLPQGRGGPGRAAGEGQAEVPEPSSADDGIIKLLAEFPPPLDTAPWREMDTAAGPTAERPSVRGSAAVLSTG